MVFISLLGSVDSPPSPLDMSGLFAANILIVTNSSEGKQRYKSIRCADNMVNVCNGSVSKVNETKIHIDTENNTSSVKITIMITPLTIPKYHDCGMEPPSPCFFNILFTYLLLEDRHVKVVVPS
jgi:hypothetical protein